MTAPTHALAAPTTHPVLMETTRTHLVWIQADTPAQARRAAQKNPEQYLNESAAAPVDASTDTAAWLDLEPEAYQRLDDYFAADGAGPGAA